MSNPVYRFVRSIRRRKKARLLLETNTGLCAELTRIPIVRSGLETVGDKERPFIEVESEGTFYSQIPDESERYFFRALKPQLPSALNEEAFRTAMDYVLRYRYPHCMPHLTMPYSEDLRRQNFFHPQHHETIADLPGKSAAEIEALQEIFRPKPGEQLLDMGAYIGMGVRRWLVETRESGKACSLEAMPDVFELLQANTQSFSGDRVQLFNRAASDVDDQDCEFQVNGRQQNSLNKEVVEGSRSIQVKTLSGDTAIRTALDGRVDMISITINGAEPEAIRGLHETLSGSAPLRILVAGWYERDGVKIGEMVEPLLREYGMETAMGKRAGLYAWRGQS